MSNELSIQDRIDGLSLKLEIAKIATQKRKEKIAELQQEIEEQENLLSLDEHGISLIGELIEQLETKIQ